MTARIKRAAIHLVSCICLMSTGAADPTPRVVQWNKNEAFGPDGPWNAVTVGVGTDAAGNPLSQVNLLPGAMGESIVFNTDYCSEADISCPAQKAGFWDANNSRTVIENVRKDPATVWQWGSSVAMNQTGAALECVDQVSINTSQGLVAVNNTMLASATDDDFHLPDGSTWAQTIGSLSLGIHGGSLAFPNTTGNTIPGYLNSQNEIPSNSVGLHYGSANLGIEGSMVYGGYDQSRVIGDVGVFQPEQPGDIPTPNLVDVQIGVESGDSPSRTVRPRSPVSSKSTKATPMVSRLSSILCCLTISPQTKPALTLPNNYPSLCGQTWVFIRGTPVTLCSRASSSRLLILHLSSHPVTLYLLGI